jgi:LacI family transcriptional regulator
VTIADVAKRAGVSSTTVSFVLSGRDMGISPATADRVVDAARALGYDHANRRRGERIAHMPVIAFVTDTVASDLYGGEMIRGAIQAAGERDHGIVTIETQGRGPSRTTSCRGSSTAASTGSSTPRCPRG